MASGGATKRLGKCRPPTTCGECSCVHGLMHPGKDGTKGERACSSGRKMSCRNELAFPLLSWLLCRSNRGSEPPLGMGPLPPIAVRFPPPRTRFVRRVSVGVGWERKAPQLGRCSPFRRDGLHTSALGNPPPLWLVPLL
jgi:hypothetical protein